MKKTISLALVFSFIFALAVQLPALAIDTATSTEATSSNSEVPMLTSFNPNETSTVPVKNPEQINKPETRATSTAGLEKIQSPTYINLFEKIIKIGQDLFGVKKVNTNATTTKATTTLATKTTSLEKIVSLGDVKLFEQIKKIGNDLFGIRKKGAYILPTMTSDQITCVSAAIDTKDSKISEALTVATAEINSAITARGICQKAALSVTTEKQSALNACNRIFTEASKKAADKTKNTQKEVWTVYNSSLKTCSVGTTEIKIEDGGQNVTEALN